jgi:addiction module HigA family antidote
MSGSFSVLKTETSPTWAIWITIEKEMNMNQERRMHNPPHPGFIIRELCLEPLHLTVTEAARVLGVSKKTLSMILNGRAGVSPVMAIRLSKAFGSTPETWLAHQRAYDLWQARQHEDDIIVDTKYRAA